LPSAEGGDGLKNNQAAIGCPITLLPLFLLPGRKQKFKKVKEY